MRQVIAIARECGGSVGEDQIRIIDGTNEETRRPEAVGAWRNAFIGAPYQRNTSMGMGVVAETLETSITWDRWLAMDGAVRTALQDALDRVCGGGRVTCRFTHVYPDGPAPLLHLRGHGEAGRRTGDARGDQAGRVRCNHGRRWYNHPPSRRWPGPPPLVRISSVRTPSPPLCGPPSPPWIRTGC